MTFIHSEGVVKRPFMVESALVYGEIDCLEDQSCFQAADYLTDLSEI